MRALPVLVVSVALTGCGVDSSVKVTNNTPTAEIVSHNDGDALVEGYEVTFRGTGYDTDDGASELSGTWWFNGEEACAKATLADSGFTECTVLVPLLDELGDSEVTLDLEIEDSRGAGDA
jgi:hypothetical protein